MARSSTAGVAQGAAVVAPVSLTEAIFYLSHMITFAQVGRLGAAELSGYTLGTTFFHITGMSLVFGISSGMETFCGQAFGARRYPLLGVVLQRALLICTLTALPSVLLWQLGVERALLALGQQPEIVRIAAAYLRPAGPALLLTGLSESCRHYLSSQSVVQPIALVSFTRTAFTPVVNHLLIHTAHLGVVGAGVSYLIMEAICLAVYVALCIWHNARLPRHLKTWTGWSKDALRRWPAYFKVAVPSMIMICLDWWSAEGLNLLAGLLPNAQVAVAAMGVSFTIHVLVYLLATGFGTAASVRVSNELGAGRAAAAQRATFVALLSGVSCVTLVTLPIGLARGFWGSLFTRDEAVREAITSILPLLALSLIADSASAVLSGVLRGAGRQTIGVVINLAMYWGIGIPSAVLLGLKWGCGVRGLWMGSAAAAVLQGLLMIVIVCRLDWRYEAERAQRLLHASEGGAHGALSAGVALEGDSGEDESSSRLSPLLPTATQDERFVGLTEDQQASLHMNTPPVV